MLNERETKLLKMDFELTFFGDRAFHICSEDCYDGDTPCLSPSSVTTDNYCTIYEAILFAENIVKESNYITIEKNRCFPKIHDEEYFIASRIVIKDRLDRVLFNGIVNDQIITWIKPIYDEFSVELINSRISQLEKSASDEAGFDNYSTAQSLRTCASNLALSFIDKHYIPMIDYLVNDHSLLIKFSEKNI